MSNPNSGLEETTHLRTPSEVMNLERMGSAFPNRISFLRILLRRLVKEKWITSRRLWQMDNAGFGTAVYELKGPRKHKYSLICFSHEIDESQRTDRVIAEEWDSTFVLFDGRPTETDIERLKQNVPLQESGRFSATELVISRANKSVRLFDVSIECLSRGYQPDPKLLTSVGYLMRTTAVYANGKFGLADREKTAERTEFREPFQIEMLTVWLIRNFSFDLLDHIAAKRGGMTSVGLSNEWRSFLGIGNATGLGMAPFFYNHPILINNWFLAREKAVARVLAIKKAASAEINAFSLYFGRALNHIYEWNVDDPVQHGRIETLKFELPMILAASKIYTKSNFPWEKLMTYSRMMSIEAQELLVSLIIEPYGNCVDALGAEMATNETGVIDPTMKAFSILEIINREYDWALGIDYQVPSEEARFWYVSEEKLEPRLGQRFKEPGAHLEKPLHVARDVQALVVDLEKRNPKERIALFLMEHPEHRHIVRRIQTVAVYPYGEIRDNLIAQSMRPIDMLRCKLAFFGAVKFDPKSDRWTRITLFQGAPTPSTLNIQSPDDVVFPVSPDRYCDHFA